MTIGERIKQLRQEKNITQEQLAEYLNISYQSVSKWEHGSSQPDISLVVPIARFFNVTADELFGLDFTETQAAIDEYAKKVRPLRSQGRVDELYELAKQMYEKHPRSEYFAEEYAFQLLDKSRRTSEVESDEALDLCIKLCERIMKESRDERRRSGVRQTLVWAYHNQKKYDLAKKTAEDAQTMYLSCEMLCQLALDANSDEYKELADYNIITFIDCASQNIVYARRDNDDERLCALQSALKIWQAVFPDENYLFYHCRIAEIYRLMAMVYERQGDKDKTLWAIEKSLYHATAFDEREYGKQNFTSPIVCHASSERGNEYLSYSEPLKSMTVRAIRDNFKSLCGDERFERLMNGD